MNCNAINCVIRCFEFVGGVGYVRVVGPGFLQCPESSPKRYEVQVIPVCAREQFLSGKWFNLI